MSAASVQWHPGRCWLWCRRTRLPVTWIGPVQLRGAHVPMYACAQCLDALEALAWSELLRKDARATTPMNPRSGQENPGQVEMAGTGLRAAVPLEISRQDNRPARPRNL